MMLILGVWLLRDGQVSFFTKFSVTFQHAVFAVGNDWVKELGDINRIPCFAENNVTE
jgi:hypothetical protein